MITMDEKLFEEAKNRIIGIQRARAGIGTLQEKTVHAVLKNYYAPDRDMHEIPIEQYIADIYTGNEIIEIQNGNFYKMRGKLNVFLSKCPVRIVYPIPHEKWIIWINEETGELSQRRKSPLKGSAYRAFSELYRIKPYLTNENLRFSFPLIDLEEYRLLNGWSQDKKKGSCRYDRIPLALFDEVTVERREDYLQFLPFELPDEFTVAELATTVKIPGRTAGLVMNILSYLSIVEQTGKKGKAYLYRINETLQSI